MSDPMEGYVFNNEQERIQAERGTRTRFQAWTPA